MTDGPLEGRSLLPPNASPLERVLSETFAAAFDRLPLGVSIPTMIQAAQTPVVLLPWLAWEWSVDEWQPDWTEAQMRAVIAASWDVHAHKGTPYALQAATDALGYGAIVTEWWAYGGSAFHFRFSLDGGTSDWGAPQFESLYRVALRTKNVRSYLEATALRVTGPSAPIYIGAAVRSRVRVSPTTAPVTDLVVSAPVFVGASFRSRIRARPSAGYVGVTINGVPVTYLAEPVFKAGS